MIDLTEPLLQPLSTTKAESKSSSSGEVLLERTQELTLLCRCLISPVTELGRGIDPLEVHLLQRFSATVCEHGLAKSHHSLLDTWYTALEKYEVILDLSIADEATQTVIDSVHVPRGMWGGGKVTGDCLRCDRLLGDIVLSRCVTGIFALADAVHLVVGRRTMMISVLTSAGNGPLHVRRMPCTNTSDLAQTLVRLARKLLRAPSARHARESMALGDRNAVDHLVLLKDRADLDRLLEETMPESNLLGDAPSVDLDLHQMRLLLLEGRLADLGVGEDTDDGAVLLDTLEFSGDR